MRKYYYCNHCGTKNEIGTKKCLKCEKNLKMKNNPLSDYLFDQTKDDIKSNLEDSLFEKLKFLIKKYLYGIIMTLTIVGGVASNIIVRAEEEVVTEKPNITFSYKEYTDATSLYNDLVKYLKNADEAGLKSLLFETHYEEEAHSLGVNATDNIIFTLTRDGVFKNGYNEINEIIPDQVLLMNKKFCVPSDEKCFDFSNTDYNIYNYYLLAGYYVFDDTTKEKNFVGKNDFELYFIETNGKYYILDFFTNHYDPNIAAVKGNLSLLNPEKQMCYYVYSKEKCDEIYGGEVK